MGQTHWHSINLLRLQHFVEIAGHGAMLLKDALPERKSAKCLQCLNFFLKHSETGLQVKKWNFEKRSHWINCGPSSQKLRIMNSLKISTWGNCAAKSGISSLTFKNFSGGFEAPPREIFRLPGWDVDGMMASQFKLSHYLFDSRTSTWRAGQWTAAIWKFVRYFETIETFLLTCAAHPKFGFASKVLRIGSKYCTKCVSIQSLATWHSKLCHVTKAGMSLSVIHQEFETACSVLKVIRNLVAHCVLWPGSSSQIKIWFSTFGFACRVKRISQKGMPCRTYSFLLFLLILTTNFVLIKLKGFNLPFRRKLTQCN